MRKGFTLVEIMVAIALVGAMFAVFGTALAASAIRTRARFETQAVALAEGALSAALSLPSSELTNRTASPLVGLVEKRGRASVTATPGSPSSPNAFSVVATSTAVAGIAFSSPLPDGPYADVSASVSVLAPVDAGADWRSGMVFRARDLENCYRLTVGLSSISLEKVIGGSPVTLYSAPTGVDAGEWTAIAFAAAGSTISITRDGVPLASVIDATLPFGDIALVSEGGSMGSFDDLSVSGAATSAWDFDADNVGETPSGLKRLGATDLPSGTATVTVTHPTADGSLTQVEAVVGWQTTRGPRTVTATGYAR